MEGGFQHQAASEQQQIRPDQLLHDPEDFGMHGKSVKKL